MEYCTKRGKKITIVLNEEELLILDNLKINLQKFDDDEISYSSLINAIIKHYDRKN